MYLFFERKFLDFVTKRRSPDRVPMDFERCNDRNYFTTYLTDSTGKRWCALRDRADTEYEITTWDWRHDPFGESAFSLACTMPSFTRAQSVSIVHYYRHLEETYDGRFALFWSLASFYPQRAYAKDWLAQKLYNSRTTARAQRLDVLRFFVEESLKSREFKSDTWGYLRARYGDRVFRHPKADRLWNRITLIMESLCEGGELKKEQSSFYRLTANGIITLEEHELADRRHRDNINGQVALAFLTLALVFVGIAQLLVGA